MRRLFRRPARAAPVSEIRAANVRSALYVPQTDMFRLGAQARVRSSIGGSLFVIPAWTFQCRYFLGLILAIFAKTQYPKRNLQCPTGEIPGFVHILHNNHQGDNFKSMLLSRDVLDLRSRMCCGSQAQGCLPAREHPQSSSPASC